MDYLKPADFRKIKAFFKALNEGRFKVNSNINSATVLVDGIPTPVNKTECLNLLRSFPELSGEEFKDDNTLLKYLANPAKRKSLLGKLTKEQQDELIAVFEEKPVAVGAASEQAGEQEQPPVEESPATMAEGGGFPGIAGGGTAAPAPRRIIRIVPQAEKAESKLVAANKSGAVVGEHSLVTGARKNFFSSAGRFFKTNIGKFLTPQLLARGATSLIGGFLGKGIAGNPGMLAGAGLGAIAPDALKSGWLGNKLGSIGNGAMNFIPNLSTNALRSRLAKIPKASGSFLKGGRAAALGFGIFFFMAFGLALFGGSSGGTAPSTSPSPTPTSSANNFGLDYTLPLRDPSIAPLDIKDQVKLVFPGAKLDYWDNPIVARSIAEGWNPALVLALWIEETGASHTTLIQNGGSEIPVNGKVSKGHLGCAPSEDQTIDESLNCLFRNFSLYTSDQFPKFMAAYSGGPATNPFANNPNFPKNVKDWYSKLVPTGPGAIQPLAGSVVAPPADPDAQILALNILNKFGVAMDKDFNYNYLKWTWEKLHNVSNTNFLSLIRGPGNAVITVLRNDVSINKQLSCSSISLRGISSTDSLPYPEELFKVVFLHELSHIIENCYPAIAKKDTLQEIINQEDYLTFYSKNANTCPGSFGANNLNEDFAETVTYFLNDKIIEQSLGIGLKCEPAQSINPYERAKPLHKQFAQNLLGTTSSSPPTEQKFVASCPIPGAEINCPSYGKLTSTPKDTTCALKPDANPGEREVGGHCGPEYRKNYPVLCNDSTYKGSNGNLRRTAKAIDIGGAPGTQVFLPKINNQSLKWFFITEVDDGVGAKLRIFQSEQTSQGKWTIHVVHVVADPVFTPGVSVDPNQYVAKIAPGVSEPDKITGVPLDHTHVTIGLNIAEPLTANNLQEYDPGWKFPDRDLGMCTN